MCHTLPSSICYSQIGSFSRKGAHCFLAWLCPTALQHLLPVTAILAGHAYSQYSGAQMADPSMLAHCRQIGNEVFVKPGGLSRTIIPSLQARRSASASGAQGTNNRTNVPNAIYPYILINMAKVKRRRTQRRSRRSVITSSVATGITSLSQSQKLHHLRARFPSVCFLWRERGFTVAIVGQDLKHLLPGSKSQRQR